MISVSHGLTLITYKRPSIINVTIGDMTLLREYKRKQFGGGSQEALWKTLGLCVTLKDGKGFHRWCLHRHIPGEGNSMG